MQLVEISHDYMLKTPQCLVELLLIETHYSKKDLRL